jgi:hypothetical protein
LDILESKEIGIEISGGEIPEREHRIGGFYFLSESK